MKGLRRSSLRRSVMGLSALALLLSLTSFSAAGSGSQSMGDAKFVDVDGVRTRYFEGGSGEAILLVHGGHFGSSGGGAVGWMPIFSSLAAHFNVYAIDKLGMGLTDKPKSDEEYSMQATAQHIYRFLQILGIDQVHLVGHSRGGLPVANIAVNHPEMVKTLTIFDSNTLALEDPPPHSPNLSPPGPIPTKESIRKSLMSSSSTFHKDYVTDEYVEAQLEAALEGREKNRAVAVRFDALRKRFIERNPEKIRARPGLANNSGTGWWLYEVKDSTLKAIRAGRLSTPTLVIWGFNDPTATYAMGVELFELISKSVDRAQLHFFNQSGHSPYHEYPQEATNLIVGFTGSVMD
ncbi:MAG: alpha/beta hydrolase [Deltaproteobacteria bacterium]|nr:alpha/beta hydrolase [Deltaproteobacteria bacterium]